MSDTEVEYADVPYYTVWWLSGGEFLLRFFELMNDIFFFLSKQELPSNTNVDHWVPLEINFREDLIILLHVFDPTLKQNLYCGNFNN